MSQRHCTAVTLVVILGLLLAASGSSHTQGLLAALPTEVAAPSDNPTTPEKIALGQLLFWDPILSGQKDVACASCHHPDFGYAENLDLSIGANGVGLGAARSFAPDRPVRFVKRNSQTVLNTAFNGLTATGHDTPASAPMFWDLRVRSLELQALEPLKAQEEMRGDAYPEHLALSSVVARLKANAEYRRLFASAFGPREPVSEATLGRALAAFERSLVTPNAPFDRYMRGDQTAMTPAQVRGMSRFQTAGCVNCHNGPMFSDYKSHVIAVPDSGKLAVSDAGINQTYAFRTASLRNLAYTAPYMHSGVFDSLREVVNFYNRVGRGDEAAGRVAGEAAARRTRTSPATSSIRSSSGSTCAADGRTIWSRSSAR